MGNPARGKGHEEGGFCIRLASPMLTLSLSFFLSLPLLFRLIPWNAEALRVYLFARASKTHARGSPRRGTFPYSSGHKWPNEDGANLLFQGFISFPRKPSYSAFFLH